MNRYAMLYWRDRLNGSPPVASHGFCCGGQVLTEGGGPKVGGCHCHVVPHSHDS